MAPHAYAAGSTIGESVTYYHLRQTESSVELWSGYRIQFDGMMRHDWQAEAKAELRDALIDIARPDESFAGFYDTTSPVVSDVENSLFTNMTGSLPSGMTLLRFERGTFAPPQPPVDIERVDGHLHYYRYSVGGSWTTWAADEVLARWDRVPRRLPLNGSAGPAWLALRHGCGDGLVERSGLDLSPDQVFGIRLVVHATNMGPKDAIAVSENLVDGILAAFHDDGYSDELIQRLKQRFPTLDDEELLRALEPCGTPLFTTPAIRPFGTSVQFSPADERCIVGEVEILRDANGKYSELSGELFTVRQQESSSAAAAFTPPHQASDVPGHVFIVNGDLTKIACDALLIPTDGMVNITPSWRPFLEGLTYPDHFETRVMRALPARRREPHVWLGDLARYDIVDKTAVFEATIQEFVERATPEVQRLRADDRIYPWPKPRLAVNVIGTGYGGAAHVKGELLTLLIKTLESLAAKHDVDLILVAYGDKPYAAAQRARRLMPAEAPGSGWTFHPKASAGLPERAQELADAAITSHLVLFVGAGVSAGAGAPTWGTLLSGVAKTAGFGDESLALLAKKDPRDQATLIERRLQETGKQLRTEVADVLGRTTRYSLQHGLLTSLPSSEAVTTNFDSLFEAAARTGDRNLAVLPQDPQSTDGQWLLKLHGTVDHPENIVLTRSDYLAMPRQYGALIGLVQGLLLMRHMMFVGYSLQDEDFQELMHEVRTARGDAGGGRGTVLTLFHDDLERDIWAGDLDVVPVMSVTADDGVEVEVAARELEVFLDLVGHLATTSAAFFLDPTYSRLSEDEKDLRETLQALSRSTFDAQPGSVAFEVKRFLKGLGSDT